MIRLKVKEIAEQRGLSQAKLSRIADINPTTLRRSYDSDANITLDTLNRLANALGVDARELLDFSPDRPPV